MKDAASLKQFVLRCFRIWAGTFRNSTFSPRLKAVTLKNMYKTNTRPVARFVTVLLVEGNLWMNSPRESATRGTRCVD
jgi:hypothetical protein